MGAEARERDAGGVPVKVTAHLGGSPPASPRPRAAVLVIHGIGEQVQYETIARAAEGLAALHPEKPAEVNVRAIPTAAGEFRRAEVSLPLADVHVYEAYWAPITKGRVTLREVIGFLVRSAWSGIKNARSGIPRSIYGRPAGGRASRWTLLGLVIATLALASLAVVDAVALAVAAARLGLPEGIPERALNEGTLFGLIFVFASGALYIWVKTARAARLAYLNELKSPGFSAFFRGMGLVAIGFTWIMFALTVAALIALGGALVWLIASGGNVPWAPASPPPPALVVVLWAGLIAATYFGRALFIEYVGDVVAYVSPQKLDRFNAVRKEIKDVARRAAHAVYDQDYDRIAIVGHSLGSVVAYDTLNSLLRDDALGTSSRNVLGRTRLFLTFGSPLDKTAFIFATSKSDLSSTREALATLSQPLILDERTRLAIPWVNVYSRADPVSGKLDLYGKPITNAKDPDATTPLVAHNEYWDGEFVWGKVHEHLLGAPVESRRAAKSRRVPVTQKESPRAPEPRA